METVLVEKKNINEVVELLKQDEVVAFPTETVFGLGVKFGNLSALEKIYEIKHRSHSKAVSLMIYDSQDIEKYAYVNTNAQKLIDEFMPGMITLVLKKKSILSDDFSSSSIIFPHEQKQKLHKQKRSIVTILYILIRLKLL